MALEAPRVAPNLLSREYQTTHAEQQNDPFQGLTQTGLVDAQGFTEIAIERTACFGRCPAYVAVLRSDGRVAYWGESNVPHRGERRGSIYPTRFAYLARLARDLGIEELEDRYAALVTDSPTVYVALTHDERRKTIFHYAPDRSGPARLQAFENEIDRVIALADWD